MSPPDRSGPRLQLNFFDIDHRERIAIPSSNTQDPLSDPNEPPFTVANPSPEQIAGSLEGAHFTDTTGGAYTAQQASVIVDNRYRNISRERASGFDLLSRYRWVQGTRKFDVSLDALYLNLRERITSRGAEHALSGNVFSPPKVRGRLGAAVSLGAFSAAAVVNVSGPSRAMESTPSSRVSAWTTSDVQLGYTLEAAGARPEISVIAAAANLFDRRPPRLPAIPAQAPRPVYDATNTSPLRRFATLELWMRW
jgi:hypothetical protein